MAVLITGAGLLGRWTAYRLVEQGEEVVLFDYAPPWDDLQSLLDTAKVTVIQGNICERQDLTQLFSQCSIDGIIHTAGLMGPTLLQHACLGVRVNVEGSLLVSEFVRGTSSRKLVLCSSLAIYGDSDAASESYQEDQAPAPRGMYGATKAAAEVLCLALARQYGLEIAILRLAGLFGPGTYLGGAWLAPTIDHVLRRLLQHEDVSLDFFPPLGMELLYVKDAARAVVQAYRQTPLPYSTFNIGTGYLCAGHDFLAALQELFPQARLTLGTTATPPPSTAPIKPLAIQRARQCLGFRAAYDLRRACADYLAELTTSSEWPGQKAQGGAPMHKA